MSEEKEIKTPKVVSRQKSEDARQQLLAKQKTLTRACDALAADRPKKPGSAVDEQYEFDGPKEALNRTIASKTAAGTPDGYLVDLRYRLGDRKSVFRRTADAIVPDDLVSFFDGLTLSPRRYDNFLQALHTFLAYAQRHGVALARKLLIAADPELAKQEVDRAAKIRLERERGRLNKLFPGGERISIDEAFKAAPGHYKTESGFAAALRRENLTVFVESVADFEQWQNASQGKEKKFVRRSEVTSLRAVKELFKRKPEQERVQDNARKVAPNKERKKLYRNLQRQNQTQRRKRRNSSN
jgi:Bacterial protein of unknown function (DUF899)